MGRNLFIAMSGLTLIVLTALPAHSLQTHSENVCSATLLIDPIDPLDDLKPHMGDPVLSVRWKETSLFLPDIHAVWANELGSGAEGVVYRIMPRGGSRAYLLKIFHRGEEEGYGETQKQLAYWHELSSEIPKNIPVSIGLPRRGPLDHTLIFDDVLGESVRSILDSKEYSEELKGRLVRKLMVALGDYIDAMVEKHPHLTIMEDDLAQEDWEETYDKYLNFVPPFYGLMSSVAPEFYIYFSPHNIIYDRDNDRFVILDPV